MSNLSSAPGEAALSAYAQSGHQSMLTGMVSGNTLTLQYNLTPNAGTSTFNGVANASSTVAALTIDENGALLATSTATNYYLASPFQPLGSVDSASGTPFEVVVSYAALPTTVNVGESGAFQTITVYHDSTTAVTDAMVTETYSVMANDSATLLLCIDSETSDVTAQGALDGLVANTETDCYTVDAAGNAALSSITLTVNGTTVTFN